MPQNIFYICPPKNNTSQGNRILIEKIELSLTCVDLQARVGAEGDLVG